MPKSLEQPVGGWAARTTIPITVLCLQTITMAMSQDRGSPAGSCTATKCRDVCVQARPVDPTMGAPASYLEQCPGIVHPARLHELKEKVSDWLVE